jgi:hypothetical protein
MNYEKAMTVAFLLAGLYWLILLGLTLKNKTNL